MKKGFKNAVGGDANRSVDNFAALLKIENVICKLYFINRIEKRV